MTLYRHKNPTKAQRWNTSADTPAIRAILPKGYTVIDYADVLVISGRGPDGRDWEWTLPSKRWLVVDGANHIHIMKKTDFARLFEAIP